LIGFSDIEPGLRPPRGTPAFPLCPTIQSYELKLGKENCRAIYCTTL